MLRVCFAGIYANVRTLLEVQIKRLVIDTRKQKTAPSKASCTDSNPRLKHYRQVGILSHAKMYGRPLQLPAKFASVKAWQPRAKHKSSQPSIVRAIAVGYAKSTPISHGSTTIAAVLVNCAKILSAPRIPIPYLPSSMIATRRSHSARCRRLIWNHSRCRCRGRCSSLRSLGSPRFKTLPVM